MIIKKVKIKFKKDYKVMGCVIAKKHDIIEVKRSERIRFDWEYINNNIGLGVTKIDAEEIEDGHIL